MSEEKNKKALKFKTFDEIKNDTFYEINLFSKKRRAQQSKLTTNSKLNDENNIEDQVYFSFRIKKKIFFSFSSSGYH